MADKVAVVIRKLPSHNDTVVSRIVKIPAPPADVDNVEAYEKSRAEEALNDHRDSFTKKFVEFRSAEWKVEVMEVHNH